jgi:hypothetical protein
MGCLIIAHEVKYILYSYITENRRLFGGGCHLICRAGLCSNKYGIFHARFNSNGRKKVTSILAQQILITKENVQKNTDIPSNRKWVLGFKNGDHNYSHNIKQPH